ncbi:hypothetical protein NE237_000414 [Protea cynaroides]|uniref:Uncharacterized protein n=1 Tax=Protea cynaroides TaxID=273540 RepID=A0A9Q0KR73_9MAGN|nr:hypothetical protein NE237_000414 [Protea cynaroides]
MGLNTSAIEHVSDSFACLTFEFVPSSFPPLNNLFFGISYFVAQIAMIYSHCHKAMQACQQSIQQRPQDQPVVATRPQAHLQRHAVTVASLEVPLVGIWQGGRKGGYGKVLGMKCLAGEIIYSQMAMGPIHFINWCILVIPDVKFPIGQSSLLHFNFTVINVMEDVCTNRINDLPEIKIIISYPLGISIAIVCLCRAQEKWHCSEAHSDGRTCTFSVNCVLNRDGEEMEINSDAQCYQCLGSTWFMGSEEVRITSDTTTSTREKNIMSKGKEVETDGMYERIPGGSTHLSNDELFAYADSSDDVDWDWDGDSGDGVDKSDGSGQNEEDVEVEGIGGEDKRDGGDDEYECGDDDEIIVQFIHVLRFRKKSSIVRCEVCKETGHNRRTCQRAIVQAKEKSSVKRRATQVDVNMSQRQTRSQTAVGPSEACAQAKGGARRVAILARKKERTKAASGGTQSTLE